MVLFTLTETENYIAIVTVNVNDTANIGKY